MTNQTPLGTPAHARTAAPPPSVRIATLLIYGLVAVAALRTLLALVAHDALLDAFANSRGIDRTTELGRLRVESAAPAYNTIAVFSLVVFGALLLLTAYYVSRGARWARIVGTVVAALNVLNLVLAFAQPAPVWYQLLGAVAGLLAVGILVFLYRPDANAFFRRTAG